jgi:hypothetical protein
MIVFGRGFWIFQMDDMFCLCENRRIFALCNRCDGALMERPAGESDDDPLRVDFDRRPRLDFHGSAYPARVGLPPIPNSMTSSARRNLAGAVLSDVRKGKKYRAPAD